MRILDQQYTVLPIDQVRPHPANPRQGNVGAIAESVAANGFYGAVVVQRSTGYILAGNHRWQAAKREGGATIPAFLIECSDAEARRILTADNRTNDLAGYDHTALAELLSSMRLDDPALTGSGYSATDLDAIIRQAAAAASGDESAGGGDRSGDGSLRCPLCNQPRRGAA